MSFRLVPKSVSLNDLERCNGPYFVLFRLIKTNIMLTSVISVTLMNAKTEMIGMRLRKRKLD